MIAADTSTWIAFLEGDEGEDAQLLARTLSAVPLIEVKGGCWQQARESRARVAAKHLKARLGDALIAQTCVDRGIPLLTRDRDFRAFAESMGLDLVIGSAGD